MSPTDAFRRKATAASRCVAFPFRDYRPRFCGPGRGSGRQPTALPRETAPVTPHVEIPGLTLTREDFERARKHVAPHVYHTPLLTSRSLSEASGIDIRLKAELFQRGVPTRCGVR